MREPDFGGKKVIDMENTKDIYSQTGMSMFDILETFQRCHAGDPRNTDTGILAEVITDLMPKLEKLKHLKVSEYTLRWPQYEEQRFAVFDDRHISEAEVQELILHGEEYSKHVIYMGENQYRSVFKT